MCGRFNIVHTPGLDALLDSLGISVQLPPARCNIAPTESVPLLRREGVGEARWWLTPSWAPAVDQRYAMFNARCETLADSRAFRRPFRRQRGIVPMSSFLEWRREEAGKVPWLITNAEEGLAVAALWDVWEGGERPLLSCTLVTTDAAPAFRDWHRRMPVLLTTAEAQRWLDNGSAIASDDPLFAPELKFPLRLAPLARAVGNASRKDPELMAPAGDWITLAHDR
ncbi:SOS response-associated peptidase [Pseudohaliea sp.]|uniref:SOS response-associated peptidase n=1 Tax=Pseudohaliea sp. TaxID=2740289 RepID=UPI0032ECF1A6